MMQASAYGRLAGDPRPITTKSGKPMTTATMAVDIDGESDVALWLGVVTFGRVAEDLARHGKGDLVSVCGKVQRNVWTDKDGNPRERLEIIADSILSAKTTRPTGGRKKVQVPA